MSGTGYSNAAVGFGSNVGYSTNGGNDTALFFDTPGNDTFYAYADYNQSGKPLAGMAGTGYSNAASGFVNNVAYSTNGGNDTAQFFDAPGSNTFYSYGDYNQSGKPLAGMSGTAYSNSASGFGASVGYATNGSNDTAMFFDAPGSNTFYAYADYNKSGKPSAEMSGTGYSNAAIGFGTNVGYATKGSSDTASFFDAPGNDAFYAYADYNNSGQTLAGMYGSGYSNMTQGFDTNVAYSVNGGSDTASFFDRPGNDTFYAYGDYNNGGQTLAGMYGSGYSNMAQGFGANTGYATSGGNDTALFFDAPGNDTFSSYADYNQSGRTLANMSGSGYSNSASGFGIIEAYSTNGGNDTANLFAAPGNNGLYTDLAIAQLYGTENGNNYSEEAWGFQTVNAIDEGGTNTKGQGPVNYQLNYLGNWNG